MSGEVVWRGPGQQQQAGNVQVGIEQVPVRAQGRGDIVRDQGQPGGLQVSGRYRTLVVPDTRRIFLIPGGRGD